MRWLFAVLILTNGLFFYLMSQSVEQTSRAETVKHVSVRPGDIRLLTDADMNAELSNPSPAVEQVCLEWGLFSTEDAERAKASLQAMPLQDDRFKLINVPDKSSQFWVFVPPLKSKGEAQKKLDELKALGVNDAYMIQDNSRLRFAVSLGVFSNKEGAEKYLSQLQAKGVKSAKSGSRGTEAGSVTINIKSTGPDFEAAMVQLKQQSYPETSLKAAACTE